MTKPIKKPLLRGQKAPEPKEEKIEELQAPQAPSPYSVEEEKQTKQFEEDLSSLISFLDVYSKNYVQQYEETTANLEWLMKDNAAKASAIKVILQNLKSQAVDLRVLNTKINKLLAD